MLTRREFRNSLQKIGLVIGMTFTKDKTLRQAANLVLAYLQFKAKNIYLYSYPIRLTIDPCNYCNLGCLLCPVGMKASGRRRDFMSLDIFKKVIDECGKYLWEINLHNWGEPLLNKEVFGMIQYARQRKIDVNVSTNLNHFDEEIGRSLISSGLNKLIVSLDGTSASSVGQYQKGSDFSLVIANMRRLVELKRECRSKYPFIEWRFIVNKYNEHELDNARKLAHDIGVDRLEFLQIRCNMGQELLMDNRAQFENVEPWLPKDENLSMYDYAEKRKKEVKDFCRLLWLESVIQPDGAVSPCSAVWCEKFDFGNIVNSSFKEIWNGARYREARQISRGSVSVNKDHICNICKENKAMV